MFSSLLVSAPTGVYRGRGARGEVEELGSEDTQSFGGQVKADKNQSWPPTDSKARPVLSWGDDNGIFGSVVRGESVSSLKHSTLL